MLNSSTKKNTLYSVIIFSSFTLIIFHGVIAQISPAIATQYAPQTQKLMRDSLESKMNEINLVAKYNPMNGIDTFAESSLVGGQAPEAIQKKNIADLSPDQEQAKVPINAMSPELIRSGGQIVLPLIVGAILVFVAGALSKKFGSKKVVKIDVEEVD